MIGRATLPNGTVLTYKVATPRKRKPVYSHPKQLCMGARILDEIERRGGMTAMQIRKQLYEWGQPNMGAPFDAKLHRGWWSSPLYGGNRNKHGPGLLKHFCAKQGKRWVRNSVPHDDRPFLMLARLVSKNPWQAQPVYDMNTGAYVIQAVFNP